MHKVSIITTCLGIPRFRSGENRFSMPASPHQIAVLTPQPKTRKIIEASADPATVAPTATDFRMPDDAGGTLCSGN
jgi:hypothetical protein